MKHLLQIICFERYTFQVQYKKFNLYTPTHQHKVPKTWNNTKLFLVINS